MGSFIAILFLGLGYANEQLAAFFLFLRHHNRLVYISKSGSDGRPVSCETIHRNYNLDAHMPRRPFNKIEHLWLRSKTTEENNSNVKHVFCFNSLFPPETTNERKKEGNLCHQQFSGKKFHRNSRRKSRAYRDMIRWRGARRGSPCLVVSNLTAFWYLSIFIYRKW